MVTIAEFGMGLGLAGVAGIRARYPLIIIGLLSRYTENFLMRESFRFLGSTVLLTALVLLLLVDAFALLSSEETGGYSLAKTVIRVIAGSVIFAALLMDFPIIFALLFGGLVSLSTHFFKTIFIPRISDHWFEQNAPHHLANTGAFGVTILLILLPLMTYVLLIGLIILAYKVRSGHSITYRRYRNFR